MQGCHTTDSDGRGAAAAVFGAPDATWGQIITAARVAPGGVPDERDLAAFMAARLAPHKRPRRFCVVPALPLTAAGKLDRAALPSLAGRLRPFSAAAGGSPENDGAS